MASRRCRCIGKMSIRLLQCHHTAVYGSLLWVDIQGALNFCIFLGGVPVDAQISGHGEKGEVPTLRLLCGFPLGNLQWGGLPARRSGGFMCPAVAITSGAIRPPRRQHRQSPEMQAPVTGDYPRRWRPAPGWDGMGEGHGKRGGGRGEAVPPK